MKESTSASRAVLRHLVPLSLVAVLGCSANQRAGATVGGTGGALSGAAAGAVGALVFGGNVGDAAARGAVWGGTAGAVSGTMAGARADRHQENQRIVQAQRDLEALRLRIGDDAFKGLSALADCRHDVALAYARVSVALPNADFALAGYWLEALTCLDTGDEDAAAAVYPTLVERDGDTDSVERARVQALEALHTIREYRVKEGRNATCP